jgi:hypothetical protein
MINHPSYSTTTQAVSDAIARSVSRNEIVYLDHSDAAEEYLSAECEDRAEGAELVEFWGIDCDGNEWRVHLDR